MQVSGGGKEKVIQIKILLAVQTCRQRLEDVYIASDAYGSRCGHALMRTSADIFRRTLSETIGLRYFEYNEAPFGLQDREPRHMTLQIY